VPVAPKAAAIENPRLMIALIAVIDAQKMNGTVIRNPMIKPPLLPGCKLPAPCSIGLRRASCEINPITTQGANNSDAR
jgi:hypothetical protein